MAEKTKEINLFLALIVLPAVLLVAGWSWLVRAGWEKMHADEQADLDASAELIVDALASRARILGLEDFGGPGAWHDGPPDEGPHPDDGVDEASASEIADICNAFRRAQKADGDKMAFELRDEHERTIYATDNFPANFGVVGECRLRPPFSPGILLATWADGGAEFRSRAAIFLTISIGAALLLVLAFSAGGALLVHMVRHERRDAKRKTDFIDNVSHELKTPLAGIRLNAELLAEGRIADERRRNGALDAIMVESDRLAQMVDRLLDFSRVEKGTYRYRPESFDLAAFVGDPAELQAIAAISGGRAKVSFKGEGATVVADKNAVRQIGINLVTNAVKYSKDGIDIEVEGCEIRYMDRGPGIPRGEEEKIFERFHRVDNLLTASESGSGLGLPIARGIARGMGGDVVYSRRPGGGSVFTLRLKT